MLQNINALNIIDINAVTLTRGSIAVDFQTNSLLFDAVFTFIKDTNRL